MRTWLTVVLLGAGLVIAYVDRTNLSVALASPEFRNFFQLSDGERGLLNSAFFWSYTILQIPAGLLIDRFGVKWPVMWGLLLWCAASAATASTAALWQLIGLRLALGIGESVIFPSGLSWIHRNIEERRRGLAAGIFVSGTKWGPAIGAPLAAWLISRFGWRSMFRVIGVGGLIWLVPWVLLAREGVRAASTKDAGPGPSVGELLRSRMMWGAMIGTFCYNYFLFFSITWMPAYFVERRHLSLNSMGTYTMFSFAGTAIVAILAGAAADAWIRRGADAAATRRWFTIAGLVGASTEVIGAVSDSNQLAVFFAIFSMAGLGLATANYWALTQTLAPKAAAGRVAGLQNTALNLAGIVAPVLTGWLKQTTGSYTVAMQAIWLVLLVGIWAYVFLVRAETAPVRVGVPSLTG
ncbi:MAG: MFS transporter [Acidobacteriia bacterium]|nr:MFS transporter [Terriglobia bacterium]